MLPKELRQVVKLSGGKIIVSEGDVEESYVVMSLGEYIKESERRETHKQEEPEMTAQEEGDGLTNEELLDRINVEIAQLQQRKNEIQLEEEFEEEEGKSDIRYEQVRA